MTNRLYRAAERRTGNRQRDELLAQDLLTAVDNDNVVEVHGILSTGEVDPNIQGRGGWTALQRSSMHLNCKMARLLLRHGADVNNCNKEWNSPIVLALGYYYNDQKHVTAKQDLLDYVRLLLDHGARVDTRDNSGRTLLHLASKSASDLTHVVHLLFDHGADANIVDGIEGMTALQFAARCGNEEIVRVLLRRGGVDPNKRDFAAGNTELHVAAASKGTVGVLKVLLENRADKSTRIRNRDGKVPLELACERNNLDAVFELYQHGIGDGSISPKKN